MGDWNNLHIDLLQSIASYLNTYTDYVRFRAICGSWRTNLPKWPKQPYNQVPWLMLPCDNAYNNDKFRGFYNPLNHEVCYLELPQLRGEQFYRGSSKGWLLIVEHGLFLKLFNPLTKSQIQLPPIYSLTEISQLEYDRLILYSAITNHYSHFHVAPIHKIVLSSSVHDFIAVAIYGHNPKLAFTKVGDYKWTPIPTSLEDGFFEDCIFFKGKFYALNNHGNLVVVSCIDTPMLEVVNVQVEELNLEDKLNLVSTYLVSTDDELFMVEKYLLFKIVRFNLFKLDWTELRWLKINKLDGYSIFLGLNDSICISSKYCPKLKGNQIYYTEDSMMFRTQSIMGGFDFDVIDITSGKSYQSPLLHIYDPFNIRSNPIWVVLNPC